MTVLYFLMTVFTYSKFYRMNCIMFTFTISSFLWNVGLYSTLFAHNMQHKILLWGGRRVRPVI